MIEKVAMKCLRYWVVSEQFLLHVSKLHKVYHCLQPSLKI
uniref:Uncharacterized protein n=1 Tax=Rhizophora mucronata TaxID=61149 RepID=A0A2P2PTD3_RHIMU